MKPSSIALITGGSSGIGLAIAHLLAKRGYSLLLVSNQAEELEKCRAAIEASHRVTCLTLFKDLTAASSAQEVFDFCAKEGLQVDVLVNNAGILVFSEVVDAPVARVNALLQLHIHTPVMLCRLLGAEMAERRSGHILNVSSISAVMPYPGISLYGPSKTFIRFFTRALRTELRQQGVEVCCFIPGATETALYDPARVNLKLAKRLGVMHTAEFVAKRGIEALFSGRSECVPGWLNKVTVALLPLVPQAAIALIHRHTDLIRKGNVALG
jgi:short-subunit dehydrogenase